MLDRPRIDIQVPSVRLRSYLKSFDVAAVVEPDGGGITITRDLGRVVGKTVAVYWTTAAGAVSIHKACKQRGTNDIVGVAAELHVGLTSHVDCIKRAEAAMARLDTLVAAAKSKGLLKQLNGGYASARLQARQRGEGFPPYAIVYRRFVQALYRCTAGELPTKSLVDEALSFSTNKEKAKTVVR
jgi:hypothetical protein